MPRLTRVEQDQIELLLADVFADYRLAYGFSEAVSAHVQADFSQALDYWSTAEPRVRPVSLQGVLADVADNSAEIARLKAELKKAGKAYGRASAAIGSLRRDLALARLYRVCWKRREDSDCPGCREVFAETPSYERVPELTPEQLASIPRRTITMEYFGPIDGSPEAAQSFAAAIGDDVEADAVMAQELADDEVRICAAAYTGSGRDTGHALCGSAEGPVTLSALNVSCPDCMRILDGKVGIGEED